MKKLNILILLAGFAAPACAGSAGADPFNFLFLDSGARGVGLGGAYTALAADANALHYNPAGLGKVADRQVTFMHNQYFQDITQEYLAYASPKGWGASFNYLDFGGAPNTTISNPSGTGLGEVNLTDLAIGLGYGRELKPGVWAGAGLKLIRESIAGESAQGLGLDLGAMISPAGMEGFTFGAALQNLGSTVKFQGDDENMPLNLRAGAAYSFSVKGLPALLALDMVKERGDDASALLGAEVIVANKFPVRLGYNGRNDDGSGIAAGLGYIHNNFNFDYAFAPFKDLGSTHRFSVTYMWGRSVRAAAPVEAAVPVQQPAEPAPVAQPVQAPVSAAVEAPVAPVPQPVVPETAAPAAPAQPVESAPAAQPAAPEAPAAQPAEVPAPAAPETPAAVPAQ